MSLAPALSPTAASELIELMIQRGYLHDKADGIVVADVRRGNLTQEARQVPAYHWTDDECQIVILGKSHQGDACCCTYPTLQTKLIRELDDRFDGRCSMAEARVVLGLLSEQPLKKVLLQCDSSGIFQVADDFISPKYLDCKMQQLVTAMANSSNNEKGSGKRLVSDIANRIFQLPTEATLRALESRIHKYEGEFQLIDFDIGGKAVVSTAYLATYRTQVQNVLLEVKEPVVISDLCQTHHWDDACSLVAVWVKELADAQDIPGTFHKEQQILSSLGAALYEPHCYGQEQRQQVDSWFASQGYLTASKAVTLGLSKSKMGEYVQESFPTAVEVSEALVVNPEVIIAPLEAVIQEAIAMDGFVDLQLHIPVELVQEQPLDVRTLWDNHVLPILQSASDGKDCDDNKGRKRKKKGSVEASLGIFVVSSNPGGCLFVSRGMVHIMKDKVIAPLIGPFAKARAEEIDTLGNESATASSSSSSKPNNSKKKGRQGGKKAAKSAGQVDDGEATVYDKDVVSLVEVLKALVTEYTELADISPELKSLLADSLGQFPALSWDPVIISGEGNSSNSALVEHGGLLADFCRTAFYTDEFVANCQNAIQAETERIQSVHVSKASVSRKDAAAKVRSVESAFEDAFISACYMFQAQAKFWQFLADNEEKSSEEAKDDPTVLYETISHDFLRGCGAHFTSRLTQYCLFKNEVNDAMFYFQSTRVDDSEGVEVSPLPDYCSPVDSALRKYPSIFLSCTPLPDDDDVETQSKDPLPRLRELLPGSIGVSLARQWILCGGDCYQGGTKVDDSGQEFTRPGDVAKLIDFVEENCLSLCGLPFKKFDKKSEKQFLFARRQQLSRLLGAETDPAPVLDLTIMLLFQQVKNVVAVVSCSELRETLLKRLTQERKISKEVADLLTDLAKAVQLDGSKVDIDLVEAVRACGLCRDISKHQIC